MKDEAVKDAENLRVEVYSEAPAASPNRKSGSPYLKKNATSVGKLSNGWGLICQR